MISSMQRTEKTKQVLTLSQIQEAIREHQRQIALLANAAGELICDGGGK
jgi:hypothetical protein